MILLQNISSLLLLIEQKQKTYNSEDSLVVTHPTTNSPACGLSTAERTGSPIFHTLWSYVSILTIKGHSHLTLCDRTIVSSPSSSFPLLPFESFSLFLFLSRVNIISLFRCHVMHYLYRGLVYLSITLRYNGLLAWFVTRQSRGWL
ncbi:hypothetical protein ACN38_g12065 [Penicillium nordicum]|uniref:Uncharacterized protein n=1 Tax=Penicillium nordicum TaxID=229535 RepID=A0A0N0RXG5_9EURO|nr:hypothetical protein ACN38_g12065 [Penicillium nordicum]